MKNYFLFVIALFTASNASGAILTISKTLADLDPFVTSDVRLESDGSDTPIGRTRLTDNIVGFAGFDESLYGDLLQVDASFQYLVENRYFARIDDGFGSVSADMTISERIFIRRDPPPLPAILLNDVVNTETFSPSCSADSGTGCLEIIEDFAGIPTAYNFSYTGSDADFFLETIYLGVLFDFTLDNVLSTATGPWRVAGGSKPTFNNPLLEANISLTYTYRDPAAVPIPAAAWLFATGLIGLIGFAKRRKAA